MEFIDIINELGIENYPEKAKEIFEQIDLTNTEFISKEFLNRINTEFSVFGEFEKEVIEYATLIKDEPELLAWLNIGIEYLRYYNGNVAACKAFPMPQTTKNEHTMDIFPLIILLDQIPKAYNRYVARGFSHDDSMRCVSAFANCFKGNCTRFKRVLLTQMYYSWLCNYVGAMIFNLDGFNFEVRKFSNNAIYIKNKKTSQLVPLILNEKIHKSGYILGAAGCVDEEDSFVAEFEETDDAFIGYTAENGLVVNKKNTYLKSEWEKFIAPGDDMISFHIPKNADFSAEHLDRAFSLGANAAKNYYPDFNLKCIFCVSWLLSPKLKEILSPNSKITAFGDRFIRFPQKDEGKAVFTFVFPPNIEKYEDLPENTSLERGLKNIYLNGEYIYNTPGLFEI